MTTDLSFPASEVKRIAAIDGVEAVSGALTLSPIHVAGKIPEARCHIRARPPVPGGPPTAGAAAPGRLRPRTRRRSPASTSRVTRPRPRHRRRRSPRDTSSRAGPRPGRRSRSPTRTRTGSTVGDKVSRRRPRLQGRRASPRRRVGGEASDIYVPLAPAAEALRPRGPHQRRCEVRAADADSVGVGREADRVRASRARR